MPLSRFSSRFLNLVLKPIVTRSVSVGEAEAEGGRAALLTLRWEGEWRRRPEATEVFLPLAEAFGVLFKGLGHADVEGDGGGEGGTSLMAMVGERCFAPFAECLIRDCLAPAVPSK